ncbi:MAG: hypothetical protein HY321_16055 [Armatimonadetes bacterium]|nr:hypothetical protein [Armatimonadota bacterium]
MATETLEGTWEEILEHARELAGRRVRVTVLGKPGENPPAEAGLDERQRRMLAWLDEWHRTPLSDEERQVLDDFEQFRKEHPFQLRRLDLEEDEA